MIAETTSRAELVGTEQFIEADAASIDVDDRETDETRLERLMKRSLQWRDKAREACEKLRQVEFKLRTADEKKRSRIQKMHQAALDEYRNARTEAARARTRLLNTLRMQPSRS